MQIEKVESILPTSNDPEELGYPEEDLITEDEKQHQQPHEKKTVLDIQAGEIFCKRYPTLLG